MAKTIDELVAKFVKASKKHYEFTLQGDWKYTNKEAKKIFEIFKSIIVRGDQARQALLEQVDNENLAVASMAATFSLRYKPERATAVLKCLATKLGVIGFGATQALKRWSEGEWHLEI